MSYMNNKLTTRQNFTLKMRKKAFLAIFVLSLAFIYNSSANAFSPSINLPEFKDNFTTASIVKNESNIKDIAKRIQFQTTATKVTHYISGTGFFVDYNHIVTNQHVVKACNQISIRGAIKPAFAKVTALDEKNDLALLETSVSPTRPGALRDTKNLNIGENVAIIGYPLNSGVTGKYVVRTAKITDVSHYSNLPGNIQFTDSVEKGNSGGPLLDQSGTIVGVVVGKINFYFANNPDKKDKQILEPVKTSSLAINLETLKNFLNKYNVNYYTNDINTVYETSYMEQSAKDYIVNIHCITSEETIYKKVPLKNNNMIAPGQMASNRYY